MQPVPAAEEMKTQLQKVPRQAIQSNVWKENSVLTDITEQSGWRNIYLGVGVLVLHKNEQFNTMKWRQSVISNFMWVYYQKH